MKGTWELKTIKLISGEEIITLIKINSDEEQSAFALSNPMLIMDSSEMYEDDLFDDEDDLEAGFIDENDEKRNIMNKFNMETAIWLSPWFRFGANNKVEISSNSIVAVSKPSDDVAIIYKKVTNSIIESHKKLEKDRSILKSINKLANNDYSKDTNYTEFNNWFKSLKVEGIKINSDE